MNPSQEKTQINWYPGHMLKAKKEIAEILKRVDIVLELRDARIPQTSINQDFESVLQNKPRIILFNKSGLADASISDRWRQHFHETSPNLNFMFIDGESKQGTAQILPKAKELMQPKWEKFKRKGIRPPALRLMIIGIPNVGKSTLINRLVKKKAVDTGPRPGITKKQEWIRLGKDVELLDTPGVLWPKFNNDEEGFRLAITGAIKDTIVGIDLLAIHLVDWFIKNRLDALLNFYQIDVLSMETSAIEYLETIAHKRGCLKAKGEVDLMRVSALILKDFRAGQLGRVSFDAPDDV